MTLALKPINNRTGSIKSGEFGGMTEVARRNPYERKMYISNALALRVLRNENW
jgi:hypothetical protein